MTTALKKVAIQIPNKIENKFISFLLKHIIIY